MAVGYQKKAERNGSLLKRLSCGYLENQSAGVYEMAV
jgi:hypothetical protein